MGYTLYLIRCRTPLHFYVGITRKPWQRWEQHRRGKGSQFTQRHGVIQVYRVEGIGHGDSITTTSCDEMADRALRSAEQAEWAYVLQLRVAHPDWVFSIGGDTDWDDENTEDRGKNDGTVSLSPALD